MEITTRSTQSCRYCGADVTPAQRRCRECESWLAWKAFLFYPDTIWSQLAVLLTAAGAILAWFHAIDARAERVAAEALRREVSTVAEHVTRLAVVVADGSTTGGPLPAAHRQQIDSEREALLPYLSSTFSSDLRGLLADLHRTPEPAPTP